MERSINRLTKVGRGFRDIIVSILIGVFFFSIIFGDVLGLDYRVMGIRVTLYRVCVLGFFLFYFLLNLKRKRLFLTGMRKEFIVFFILWGLYAIGQLIIFGNYGNQYNLTEGINLAAGFLCIYVIFSMCADDLDLRTVFSGIRIALIIILVIALWEIFTAKHLSMSRYMDDNYWRNLFKIYPQYMYKTRKRYVATGIFYNQNDLCAMIAILMPSFCPRKEYGKLRNVIYVIAATLLYYVILRNDSWICIQAILIGIVVYLVINKSKIKSWVGFLGWFYLVKHTTDYTIQRLIVKFIRLFNRNIDESLFVLGDSTSLSIQITAAEGSYGSLYLRLNTYLLEMKGLFTETYGAGFGPRGVQQYLERVENVGIVNPHGFWIEILVNYGLVIGLLFIIFCVVALIRLIIKYRETGDSIYIMLAVMDAILVGASMAPSSFINFTYIWIPIGLSIGLAGDKPFFNRAKKR